MSRILMFAVLAILLSLLAVMGNIVNPKPKEPPKPPDPAIGAKIRNEQEKKERQMMQTQMKKRQDQFKKQQEAVLKEEEASGMKTNLKSRPPLPKTDVAPNPTAMDISSDWFAKRKDGSAGLSELAAEQKRVEEAAKKFRENMKPETSPAPVAR